MGWVTRGDLDRAAAGAGALLHPEVLALRKAAGLETGALALERVAQPVELGVGLVRVGVGVGGWGEG